MAHLMRWGCDCRHHTGRRTLEKLHVGLFCCSELEDSSDDEGLGAIDAVSRPPLAHARTIGIPRPQRLKAASTPGAQSMSGRTSRTNHVHFVS